MGLIAFNGETFDSVGSRNKRILASLASPGSPTTDYGSTNDLTLASGTLRQRHSGEPKWRRGIEFDGASDPRLESTSTALQAAGDFACTFVFEIDTLPGTLSYLFSQNATSGANKQHYSIRIDSDGDIRYETANLTHGPIYTTASTGSIISGMLYHTGTHTYSHIRQIGTSNSTDITDVTVNRPTATGTGQRLRIGEDPLIGNPFEGAIYELRLWFGASVPDMRVLRRIVDEGNTDHEFRLEGNETACYFFDYFSA